ncbi:MAG: hypothetical protein QF622_02215 [Candidatus Marinimicrobia bacterium]|jgi:hypothetical protein|nr:hypothetical protein [Candidatus Neomarinimicrobiota bacterium]
MRQSKSILKIIEKDSFHCQLPQSAINYVKHFPFLHQQEFPDAPRFLFMRPAVHNYFTPGSAAHSAGMARPSRRSDVFLLMLYVVFLRNRKD